MTKESRESSKKEVSTTSTPQFQCPMLKPSNYSLWAIRMQIILEANGLWEMIQPEIVESAEIAESAEDSRECKKKIPNSINITVSVKGSKNED
ncbi:zinc finger, CCHC-type containing protein [Tanacetum coccineum]